MSAALPPRSWLFVPGDSERKQTKALACPADALILDLEDSVAAAQLPAARRRIRELLEARSDPESQQLWVRVHSPASAQHRDDMAAVVPGNPDGIVLPKVSSMREITAVSQHLSPSSAIKLLVIAAETPQAALTIGQWNLADVGIRLAGLTWGMEDLEAALGASGKTEGDGSLTFTFELVRSQCLLAAAAAGVQAVDSIHANFRDAAGLARETSRARRDGFTGKLAIHPEQISTINAGFSPTEAEIEQARRIIIAFAAQPDIGVTSLDGQMLDRPHLVRAQRILELAAYSRVGVRL